ncbi:MAG: aminotransferase class I/II-fold pyridoxal phosphate-dependent enzyme, partial [Bacteroidia bacterium]|nr:aminotransferase class I/II-fold pyridoxal phosphate-dependent enzyme [Bacteroidia bacterium]
MKCEVPFHRPSLSDKERAYLLQALEEAYWGGGKWVAQLEERLSALFGREAVVVSSGTAALHLALHLLLEKKTGEVILPTWTFSATASEVIHAGGIPVLADVSPSLHLCAATIEERFSPHTRGIIVMHYAGVPAPMDEILALKERHGLFLIEDACHALGSYYKGQPCGTFGDIAAFSLHATKPIAAGQGGFLLTADSALAEKARRLRQ